MRLLIPALLITSTLSLVACDKSAPPPPAAVPATDAAPAEGLPPALAAAVPERVEVPVNDQAGEPLLVGAGGQVASEISLPKAGKVVGAGVQIGNFGGSSDGALAIKLCQGEVCAEGTADLKSSIDNEYLMVKFATPVDLAAAPAVLTLTRTGGEAPLAVWTYSATAKTTTPDGKTVERSPKLALDLSR